jgi:flavin reductase (DIM6/NTAB) family NADH-FMN oxidoreductase RutF
MTDSTPDENQIDTALFRQVLGHFCSGITVISALHDDEPVGFTCQSFFSVSLNPPLVAFSAGNTSTSYPLIRSVGSLVINILASEQGSVSTAFARSGENKWGGVAWRKGSVIEHPVIDDTLASLECDIESEIAAGDHTLVIARVRHLHVEGKSQPLLFFQGSYRQLQQIREMGAPIE